MSRRHWVASTEGTQCRVQRWPGRIIDKRKLPGNRTWGSGELWTKLWKKQKQSKAWNFFCCSGWGSFFFLPGKIPYCCGPWLLSITILPFPQRKFSLDCLTGPQGDSPVPDEEHHTLTTKESWVWPQIQWLDGTWGWHLWGGSEGILYGKRAGLEGPVVQRWLPGHKFWCFTFGIIDGIRCLVKGHC